MTIVVIVIFFNWFKKGQITQHILEDYSSIKVLWGRDIKEVEER